MTCLTINCDSLQCVTVNRVSYSWPIAAHCSQSPTFICPIVSFASRNTLWLLRAYFSILSAISANPRSFLIIFSFPSVAGSYIYLVNLHPFCTARGKQALHRASICHFIFKNDILQRLPLKRHHPAASTKSSADIVGISSVCWCLTATRNYK